MHIANETVWACTGIPTNVTEYNCVYSLSHYFRCCNCCMWGLTKSYNIGWLYLIRKSWHLNKQNKAIFSTFIHETVAFTIISVPISNFSDIFANKNKIKNFIACKLWVWLLSTLRVSRVQLLANRILQMGSKSMSYLANCCASFDLLFSVRFGLANTLL